MIKGKEINDLDDNRELTVKEVASLLVCHIDTLYRKLRRGELAYSNVTGIVITGRALKEYVIQKHHKAVRIY